MLCAQRVVTTEAMLGGSGSTGYSPLYVFGLQQSSSGNPVTAPQGASQQQRQQHRDLLSHSVAHPGQQLATTSGDIIYSSQPTRYQQLPQPLIQDQVAPTMLSQDYYRTVPHLPQGHLIGRSDLAIRPGFFVSQPNPMLGLPATNIALDPSWNIGALDAEGRLVYQQQHQQRQSPTLIHQMPDGRLTPASLTSDDRVFQLVPSGMNPTGMIGAHPGAEAWSYSTLSPIMPNPRYSSTSFTSWAPSPVVHHPEKQKRQEISEATAPVSDDVGPGIEASNKKSKKRTEEHDQSGTEKKPKLLNPELSLNGERRLIIDFENFGTVGGLPQVFGKARRLVPDGLSGSHTLYNERWHFRVTHSKPIEQDNGRKIVCLTWHITNKVTGQETVRTETISEAVERTSNGRTISNEVFRAAMETRALSIEKELENEANPVKRASILSRAKALRPRCFNQGILVFGLQHRIVQEKLNAGSHKDENETADATSEEK